MNIQGMKSLSRRRLMGSIACAGLVPALAGCLNSLAPLRVGSIVFPGYELLFLARERGLLDPQAVRLVELFSNTDTLRALVADQLEAACLTLDEVLSARAEGLDLRVVLILDQSLGADVVVSRKPLPGLFALRGKRIAVEDSAAGALMLGALLQAAGLKVADVVKVPMTLDQSLAYFSQGRADAVVTAEPWAGQMQAAGGVRLFDSRAIPGRIVDVLAVQAKFLDVYQAALQQLVNAHFDAVRFMRDQPVQASRLMAPRLQIAEADVPAAFRGLALPGRQDNVVMLTPKGSFLTSVDALQGDMLRDGLLHKRLQPGDWVDSRFLAARQS